VKTPPDGRRRDLAKTIARSALLRRRAYPMMRPDGQLEQMPVTRDALYESISETMTTPRYRAFAAPALQTVIAEVRTMARPENDLLADDVAPRRWHNQGAALVTEHNASKHDQEHIRILREMRTEWEAKQ